MVGLIDINDDYTPAVRLSDRADPDKKRCQEHT